MKSNNRQSILLCSIFLTVLTSPFFANDSDENVSLLDMEIESLMDLEIVTTVEGKASSWFNAPSAIYVITSEDIRRAGHRNLAELFRMVPGMLVLKDTSSKWNIASRGYSASGFSDTFSRKLLVLIDGRTVYDPIFSNTYWDRLDTVFEDIDRIEVSRGPGATLWGANAVGGVINIITKNAQNTQGTYATGGGGNYHRGFGALRYGNKLNENTYYRVWTKYSNQDEFKDHDGRSMHDDWDLLTGGFRIDIDSLPDNTKLTLQGDIHHTDNTGEFIPVAVKTGIRASRTFISDVRDEGGNILFRLNKNPDKDKGWDLQGYYERIERSALNGLLFSRDTYDIDFRHRFKLGDKHRMLWGFNWRFHQLFVNSSENITYTPPGRETNLYSAFIQDTITVVANKIFVLIGSKFEINDYTGFEWQPSGRIWWTPDDKQMFWGAISRPVRTPSRVEDDITYNLAYVLGTPVASINGNTEVESEKVTVYEAGYRFKLTEDITADTTFFYNEYKDLISIHSTTYGLIDNYVDAMSYGFEEIIKWQVNPDWRLEVSHSYMHQSADQDEYDGNGEHSSNMVKARSYLNITDNLEFNAAMYYTSPMKYSPNRDNSNTPRFDAGITWRPYKNMEVSVVGQNLMQNRTFEKYRPTFQSGMAEVPRSFYVQMTLRF